MSNSVPRHIPQKSENRESSRYLCSNVHCRFIHNNQKVETPQVPQQMTGETKCGMEYYSVIKRDEVLIQAIIWIKFENITQSEIRQKQKDKYCMNSLI